MQSPGQDAGQAHGILKRHAEVPALAARRRRVHALKLQAVGVGKEHGIVSTPLVVLRVLGGRVEDGGADTEAPMQELQRVQELNR